jgi:hypothetical protein
LLVFIIRDSPYGFGVVARPPSSTVLLRGIDAKSCASRKLRPCVQTRSDFESPVIINAHRRNFKHSKWGARETQQALREKEGFLGNKAAWGAYFILMGIGRPHLHVPLFAYHGSIDVENEAEERNGQSSRGI